MPHLIIIRGLPGSGKSTLAKKFNRYMHFEADMWMCDEDGEYKFDSSKLKSCHEACQETVRYWLCKGVNVVVSNTFSRIWEMRPYLDMPCEKTVITCHGNFGSIHDVPDRAIREMRDRWEYYTSEPGV